MNYLSFCLIVKDEDEDNLIEWIEYHLSIGVEAFFIYDNQSTTPVRNTLRRFIDEGIVAVFDCPGEHQQDPAYTHCLHFLGHTTRWLGFIDSDEFVVSKTTLDLKSFLEAYEPYGGLSINWLIFGSNGWEEKPPLKQTAAFTHYVPLKSGELGLVKCIIQPSKVINMLTPHEFLYKGKTYAVGEHFDRVEGAYRPFSADKIQLNHYLLRSKAQFEKKLARGRSDHNRPYYHWEHFDRINRQATAVDNSILEVIQQTQNHPPEIKHHILPSIQDVPPPSFFSPIQIDFARYNQIAFEAKTVRDEETLIKVYKEAIRKYPDLFSSYLCLYDALIQQGNLTEAWQTIQTAAALAGENNGKVLLRKAKCLALMGKIDLAIKAYQNILTIDPNQEEAWLWLAKLYTQIGNLEAALACYDKIVQDNPWNQPAWENIASLLQKIAARNGITTT